LHMFFKNDRPVFRAETMEGRRTIKVLLKPRILTNDQIGEIRESPFRKKDFYRLLPCRRILRRKTNRLRKLIGTILHLGQERFLRKTRKFRQWTADIDDPPAALLRLLFIFLSDPLNRPRFVSLSAKPWFEASLRDRNPGLLRRHISLELPLLRMLWTRKHIRPQGSPERRLELFCRIIADPVSFDLDTSLERIYFQFRGDPAGLQAEVSRQIRRTGLPSGLAALATANLVLPYLFNRLAGEKRRVFSIFNRIEGKENNSRIDRFSGWPIPDPVRKSEAFQQGILGVYEQYCSTQCLRCPLFPANRGSFFSALLKRTA